MPFSQNRWLPTAAAIFGGVPLLVGIQLLLDPDIGLRMLDYEPPTEPSSHRLVKTFVRFFGARDMTLGLITLAVWRSGNKKLMGTTILLGTAMAAMDGFINRADVPGSEWKHWPFVPIGVLIGTGLLGILDGIF